MNRADKILTQLDEKFCGGFKNTWKDYYQVFCNPTSNELREIDNNAVRFIAEPLSKTLYVWDVGKALHGHVLHELIQTNKTTREDALKGVWGVALKKGNKLKFSDSDTLSGLNLKALKKLMNYDWKWLENYMSGVVEEIQRLIAEYPKSSYKNESVSDKILIQFDEFFGGSFQNYGQDVKYWINPSIPEMEKALKESSGEELRFVADNKTKKLYVWNAYQAIHAEVAKVVFDKLYSDRNYGRYLKGVIAKEGSDLVARPEFTYGIELRKKFKYEPMLKKWKWITKKSDIDIKLFFIDAFQVYDEGLKNDRSAKILALNEKFCKGFTSRETKQYVEVYCNPTLQEMLEAGDEIRFIARNRQKRLIISNADKALHYEIASQLQIPTKVDEDVWGTAERVGRTYKMIESDEIDASKETARQLSKYDWSWVEKKIKGITKYIQDRLELENEGWGIA